MNSGLFKYLGVIFWIVWKLENADERSRTFTSVSPQAPEAEIWKFSSIYNAKTYEKQRFQQNIEGVQ